ncbi:MAG: cell division transport system ATP-binding protein [Sphingobacteriales bacterium]|jgi:cell division transport system ATP-binding protein
MTDENSVIKITGIDIYQSDNLVLHNVNLNVNRGEFVYLVGQTGSGKSSLMKVLYGDLPLENGEGTVAGFDLLKLKDSQLHQLRRKTGIVFQDFQLLTDRTVHDNLEFVLKATGWKDKKERENRINEVLLKVELEGCNNKMPHQLSGGEQQRVVIGRALLNHPEVILADEPTGNLDPVTSKGIVALLKEISTKGTAVLMATHDYHMIETYPSRILKCEKNRLMEHQLN